MKYLKKLFQFLKKNLYSAQEICYIGGSDTLPPPLTKERESFLLDQIDQAAARQELIEHNLRLVVYIARRFENTGIHIEDLISIGTIGLIKGISTFKPDKKVRLATYASRCIENAILSQMRLWFRINPPRAEKNSNGVFWHRLRIIYTSFAPLRTDM